MSFHIIVGGGSTIPEGTVDPDLSIAEAAGVANPGFGNAESGRYSVTDATRNNSSPSTVAWFLLFLLNEAPLI